MSRRIVLSAVFHGGALVANYPWDANEQSMSGVYTATPDDALFIQLARAYALGHLSMYQSWIFPGGIVNGAVWYVVHGGLQDFAYHYIGQAEVTLEISDIKFPPGSSLPPYYTENLPAMLAYMEAVHWGVKGTVYCDGTPIDAEISVVGRNNPMRTHPISIGQYHRLLLP
eukprot:374784_1